MRRPFLLAITLLAPLALLAGTLCCCGTAPAVGTRRPTPATTTHYVATLRPLNASGVTGTVRMDLTGNVLEVTIQASGLEPNGEHYQHIHGNPGGRVACPSVADATASGVLTVDQGLAVVGPIALDLQPYPLVSGTGAIDWSRSYTLTASQASSLVPLAGHVVVLHGMTAHGTYDRALFVACGPIQAMSP